MARNRGADLGYPLLHPSQWLGRLELAYHLVDVEVMEEVHHVVRILDRLPVLALLHRSHSLGQRVDLVIAVFHNLELKGGLEIAFFRIQGQMEGQGTVFYRREPLGHTLPEAYLDTVQDLHYLEVDSH